MSSRLWDAPMTWPRIIAVSLALFAATFAIYDKRPWPIISDSMWSIPTSLSLVEGKGAFVASYTIEDVIEPYLMQLGFLDRTPRGRIGTQRAFEYFGIAQRMRGGPQSTLF